MASTTSPQPIIIQIPTDFPRTQWNGNYSERLSVVFGCMQLIMGVVSIALNTTAIVMDIYLSYSGYGIWSAPLWIIAGSFGIAAGKMKTTCLIKTTMVMSILSAATASYYIPMSAVAVARTADYWPYYSDFNQGDALAVSSLMLICGVTECVFAILASCLCCKAICCGNQKVGVQQPPAQFTMPMQQPASVPVLAQPAHAQRVVPTLSQDLQVNLPAGYQIVYTGNAGAVGCTNEQQTNTPAPPAYTINPKY